MRGDDCQAGGMWSCGPPEQRVPLDHPLRPIAGIVDTSLTDLSLVKLYSPVGRLSISPGKLFAAAVVAGPLQHVP